MEHRITLRILGIAILIILVLGIVFFQAYGGKSVVESLYEIFILVIGGIGAIALQLIIWPERFLPKKTEPEPQRVVEVAESPQFPNIQGEIMGVIHGRFQNPQNVSETLTGFCLFVSLTNETLTAAYVRDYELYVDIGAGFERISIFRAYSGTNFHFEYQGRELQIDNFQQRLLSYRNNPIEFGQPYEGILLFGGPERFYRASVQAYKLICIDVFGHRHEIVTRPSDLRDPGYLYDRFGVRGI